MSFPRTTAAYDLLTLTARLQAVHDRPFDAASLQDLLALVGETNRAVDAASAWMSDHR